MFRHFARTVGCRRLFPAVVLIVALALSPVALHAQQNTDSGPAVNIPPEATVESLFTDFMHYARLGQFTAADAYARALLAHPDLNAVELLAIASRDRKSLDTLLILIKNSTLGDSAARVLDLLQLGEHEQRKDPERIRFNVELLAGNPQQEFFARRHLAESGEYAVPQLVQVLLNPDRRALWPRVATALPQIGKPAVNPLVAALNVEDDSVKKQVIQALGDIGYAQAVPYLKKTAGSSDITDEARDAAQAAIARIESFTGRSFAAPAESLFHDLADHYYAEHEAVRADPRLAEANVWYWDHAAQALTRIEVPTPIFGSVMAMRCTEEALLMRNDYQPAIALWLAANIRREHRLGLDVESGDPTEQGVTDNTRPDVFPRALYFTQAAGPRYAHLVLQRAVQDSDSAVALGAIAALRVTAGESSLIGPEDYKQPLGQALRFPDIVVRIRAALALGAALPKTSFADAQYVIPVLAETLGLTGSEQIVVVDADERNLNRVMSLLRAAGREVIGETSFYRALERARNELQGVTGFFIATDLSTPGPAQAVRELRREFVFARTPVVLMIKDGHDVLAEEIDLSDRYAARVEAFVDETTLLETFDRARQQAGQRSLDADLALSLSLEAAQTLRDIAVGGRTVFDVGQAESALIGGLSAADENLQIACGSVLALVATPTAQRALTHVALDESRTDSLRIALFGSIAESARAFGNGLEESQIARLVTIAREEIDLNLRTAASQTLGALNLTDNKASNIIRNYYGG